VGKNVGHGETIHPMYEYDVRMMSPLLMTWFDKLSPTTIQAFPTPIDGPILLFEKKEKDRLLEVKTSIESSHVLFIGELYLFRRLSIFPSTFVDPLAQCQTHKSQFFIVSFLAKQILGILGSQFEIECIFSFVVVLITLLQYYLQVENLEMIIMVMKKTNMMIHS
jgi:hypothetical protein